MSDKPASEVDSTGMTRNSQSRWYQFRLVDLFILATYVAIAFAVAAQLPRFVAGVFTSVIVGSYVRYRLMIWRQWQAGRALDWRAELCFLLESVVDASLVVGGGIALLGVCIAALALS